MSLAAKPLFIPLALAMATVLAGCESEPLEATDPLPASTAVPAETAAMLEGFTRECEASFATGGGPPELAVPFCACSASEIAAQGLGPRDMIDIEKMNTIGETCMNRVLDGTAQ